MFCHRCGNAVTTGNSYCSACGSEIGAVGSPRDKVAMSVDSLLIFIVAIAVVGLGGPIGLIALLKESLHLDNNLILTIASIAFAPFVVIEAVFLWLLIRSQRKAQLPDSTRRAIKTNELDAEDRLLAAPSTSITEHTTRGLERNVLSRKETT